MDSGVIEVCDSVTYGKAKPIAISRATQGSTKLHLCLGICGL